MNKINIKRTLIQLLGLFILFLIFNMACFIYVIFQNQSKLISDNAIQSAQIVAENIRYIVSRNIEELEKYKGKEKSGYEKIGELFSDYRTEDVEYEAESFELFYPNGRSFFTDEIKVSGNKLKNILKSQTARSFNNALFQTGEFKDDTVELYIPIGEKTSKLVVKYTHKLKSLKTGLGNIIKQSIIIGVILLVLHLLFLLFEYRILILPMRKANVVLETQYNHIKEDLTVAEKVQLSILPKHFPASELLDIGIYFKAMEAVGGDMLDIIPIDEDHVGVLLVDVMGHGVPSALITTMLKVAFNTWTRPDLSLAEISYNINNDFYKVVKDVGYYCTFFFGIINIHTKELRYTMGNHPPQVLFRNKTKKCEELFAGGMSMGLMGDLPFEEESVILEPGDKILTFSDGIPETFNEQEQMYGDKRVVDFVEEHYDNNSQDLCHLLIDDVDKFLGNAPVTDDRSLIIVTVK